MFLVVVIDKEDAGKINNINVVKYNTLEEIELAVKNLLKAENMNILNNKNNFEIWLHDISDGGSEKLMEVFNKNGNTFSIVGDSTFIYNERFSSVLMRNIA